MHRLLVLVLLLCCTLIMARPKHAHAPVPGMPPVGPVETGAIAPPPEQDKLQTDITTSTTLDHDYIIPSQVTVKVFPGVVVTLVHNATITILGTMLMEGSSDKLITLKGDPAVVGPKKIGGQIILGKGSKLVVRHATVDTLGVRGKGAIEVTAKSAELTLDDVVFQNILGSGVVVQKGHLPTVNNVIFKSIDGSGLELYGSHVGDVSVEGSIFDNCKSYAVLTYRYQGKLSINNCRFIENGRYAVFVDGDVEFHVENNEFQKNEGAFACRKHAMEPTQEPGMPTLVNNVMTDNRVDTESDDWSLGNLIYLHGCTVRILRNTITHSSKHGLTAKESNKLPSLINFFDSNVEMSYNTIVNNSKFLYTMNIGGAQTKLKVERNLLSNVVNGFTNYEIANEASGVRINAMKNWWGCELESCVKSRILDFTDGGEKYGIVEYLPMLTEPNMDQEVITEATMDDYYGEWDYSYGVGESEVQTIIENQVTWMADKVVEESIWIKKDGTLIIEPVEPEEGMVGNLTVTLHPGVGIHVDGALQIKGAPGHYVRFVPASAEPWGSITFSKTAKSQDDPDTPTILQYAEFVKGAAPAPTKDSGPAKGGSNLGMLLLMGPNVTIQNCIFTSSASAGVVVGKGRVVVDQCTFTGNEGNAIVGHSTQQLTVKGSVFAQNKKFPLLLTHGTYNITENSILGGNAGVLCVRRRRNEDPMKVALDRAVLPTSELSRNQIMNNQYAAGADCWGDTGEDTMLLLTLAAKPVEIKDNVIIDNKCDSKAVRRRATIFLMTADDCIAMVANDIQRNYGKIYLARPMAQVESWEHPPPPFFFENNVLTNNLFFSIFLNLPSRRGFVTDNVLEGNEVSDEGSLKAQPLFEVLGGEFTRRPFTLNGNRFLSNEGTLLALRLHDLAVASGNWFSNPFIKYELEFANPDAMAFTGTGNYWGDFGRGDAEEVAQRIKPTNGKVPKRWYAHWIMQDGTMAEPEPAAATTLRDVDKASATLTFLVVVVLGFLIVLVVVVGLYCKGPGTYAMLDLDEEKPAAE